MSQVAVLFARGDSIYKTMPVCDVWDIERDALQWGGGAPVIAHPPCRAWGKLSHMANPRPGEKELALWAVDMVRKFGGVLEHPRASRLWNEKPLPAPGARDEFGGWTMPIFQSWYGHKAEKSTFLYIVGCAPAEIPDFPMRLGETTHVIAQSKKNQLCGRRPEVTKAEREHTPPELAVWLVQLAQVCGRNASV